MSFVDVSLPLGPPSPYPHLEDSPPPYAHLEDPLEQQVKQLLIHAPKRTVFGRRIISKERQLGLARVARRVSLKGEECVASFSKYRQKRFFKNSVVKKETLELKKVLETHALLLSLNQQNAVDKLAERKKTFKEKKQQLNQAQSYLKRGYQAATTASRAGKTLEGFKVKKSKRFEKAFTKGIISKDAAVECTFWSDIGVQCRQMDLEAEKLYRLRRKLTELEKQIAHLESKGDTANENMIKLRNERGQTLSHIIEQTEKVEKTERELTIGTLDKLTKDGSECAESIQKLVRDGLGACVSVKSMVKGIGLVGSLLAFATSLDTIVSNGNAVGKMEADALALRALLESSPGTGGISSVLINNMYNLKLDHLNRSIRTFREDAKMAVATLASSTLSAGKFGVAMAALAASTVVAVPGLNITAVTIAAITSAGLKGAKLYNAVKYDREGVKLDVQIGEESTRIVASSGKFYSGAIQFDAIRAEVDALMPIASDLKSSIKLIRYNRKNSEGDPEAEEFYEDLEDELQRELSPISERQLESQMKHDLLQGELYHTSVCLDQAAAYKRRLQEDRSMETIAAEFSKIIKKGDIVGQYQLFKDVLSDEDAKLEFIDFLSREDIPVTSEEGTVVPSADQIFASVLGFIRNDKHMPRSLKNPEPILAE